MIILTLRNIQNCSTEGFNIQESNLKSELPQTVKILSVSLVCKETKTSFEQAEMTVATFYQQQAETTAAVRTQEEELVEGLRTEFHETACKIQSLQAETESLRTLVSNTGFSMAIFGANSTCLLRKTFPSWDADFRINPIFQQILFPDISGLFLIDVVHLCTTHVPHLTTGAQIAIFSDFILNDNFTEIAGWVVLKHTQ